MEKGVLLIFPVKGIQLAALLQNFKGAKKCSSIFDTINFIWKGEAFHGLLCSYNFQPVDNIVKSNRVEN